MANKQQLENALISAHNAGDFEAANVIANEIKSMSAKESETNAQYLGRNLRDIPRQLGMTAGYLAETGADVVDVLGTPIRAAQEFITGEEVKPLAQVVRENFPQPQTETERLVRDVSKGVAGAAIPLKAAQSLSPVTQTGRNIQAAVTASPALQGTLGATSSGVAGTVREAGGSPTEQMLYGLGAGFGVGMAAPKITGMAQSATGALSRVTQPQAINVKIENAIKGSGIQFKDLSPAIQQKLSEDVTQALKINPKLSGDALRRLIDYRVTGATPRTAQLTLNPADVTRQKNLAKIGANSSDEVAQRLAMIENENNQILLGKLDELGANSARDKLTASQSVYDDLNNFTQSNKATINSLYGQAKSIDGRLAELDAPVFIKSASKQLEQDLATKFIPADIKSIMNDISSGKIPLNVQVSEQFKTVLATAQRGAQDGNVKNAISIIRDSLENTPLRTNQLLGKETVDAFNTARKATYQFKQLQKNVPALKDIEAGIDPEKFFDKHVIRSTSSQFDNMMRVLPEPSKAQIKNDVLGYIKSQATRGEPNETAKLSASALNKAIENFGMNKMKSIFNADEIAQLKSIANVAKYEAFQPVGSAVNNSNTAAAALNILDRVAQSSLLGKIPFGSSLIREPVQNIMMGNQAKAALTPANVLTNPIPQIQLPRPLLPYLGLLNVNQQ